MKEKDYKNMDEIKMYNIMDNSTIIVRYRIKRGWWIFKRTVWEVLSSAPNIPMAFDSVNDASEFLKDKGVKLPL